MTQASFPSEFALREGGYPRGWRVNEARTVVEFSGQFILNGQPANQLLGMLGG